MSAGMWAGLVIAFLTVLSLATTLLMERDLTEAKKRKDWTE